MFQDIRRGWAAVNGPERVFVMKNVIITGANSGLGFETAKKIAANKDYKVILACRNMEKAEAAKNAILAETGSRNVETMQLDTSSLDSVRSFAEKVTASGEKIYSLVCNAGISSRGNSGLTADGFDIVFETNYLGHFLLAQLLLPCMEEDGRIYNVSSDMHNPPGGLTWPGIEAVAHPAGEERRNYSYSKLCMIYMAHELSRKLAAEGSKVTVNCFNPGFMGDTNFMKGPKFSGFVVKHTMPDRSGDLRKSSDALAELVTGERFGGYSGEYFDRSVETAKSSELSYNKENEKEVWEASLRYVMA